MGTYTLKQSFFLDGPQMVTLTEEFEYSEIDCLAVIESVELKCSQSHVTSAMISFLENLGFLKIVILTFHLQLVLSL